jgi:hypothetical protein
MINLEKAVGTTKKTKYTKNQRLTAQVPLTHRVIYAANKIPATLAHENPATGS